MPAGPYFTTDPISLMLAADTAFAADLEGPDIVWQLELEPTQPLSLRSSLGLQARSFRVFPSIGRNKQLFQNLNEFLTTPRVDSLFPGYAKLILSPDPNTQAVLEFWAREPHTLSGRITLRNTGAENAELSARVAGVLVPLTGEQGMTITKQDFKTYLRGQSGDLTIALAMNGAPKPVISPYQALEISRLLLPGEEFSTAWRCSLAFSPAQSQERALTAFPANWQAEIARLEVAEQARALEVETPLPDWNLVFKAVRDQANLLLRRAGDPERSLTFFEERNTLSPVGMASAQREWAAPAGKPSALEVRQLARTLLPTQIEAAVNLTRAFLRNLTANTDPAPPFPCLASLVWDVHSYRQEPAFLAECLPNLAEQILRWFSPQNDRDQDGLPEWSTAAQSRLTDLPIFDIWQESASPSRISSAESLGLAALLDDELDTLLRMARVVGDAALAGQIRPRQDRLRAGIARFRAEAPNASFIDRDTHLSHPSEKIIEVVFPDPLWKSVRLLLPARLNILIRQSAAFALPAPFEALGADASGEEVRERIDPSRMLWLPHGFHITTQSVFSRFDRLEGLELADGAARVYTSGLQAADISQQLGWEGQRGDSDAPAWASPQDIRFRFGLPTDLDPAKPEGGRVNLGWNCLLIERLNRLGEKKLAFDLLSRLVLGASGVLKREHALTESFRSDSGLAVGARGSMQGLLPPLLLLELAGIQIINERKVSISGDNPCPWPLIVRFRGLEVRREGKNTNIQFPNGAHAHHFGSSGKLFTE